MSHSSSLNSNQQRIRKTVEELKAEQSDKNTRILLAYEIKNREKEIMFLTNKISMIQKEIHQIDSSIDSLVPVIKTSKASLSDIVKENDIQADGWAELNKIQKDIQNMLSALPRLKREITEQKKDIQELSKTLKPLEEEWSHISEEQHELDESARKVGITLSSLEQELSIMRETNGLLYGIMPDGYDKGLVDDISVNFEQCIQNYYDEIDSQIVGVKAKTAELQQQIELENDVFRRIRPEKISLEREAQRVLDAAVMHESTLVSELEQLRGKTKQFKDQNSTLAKDIDIASLEIKDIEASIITKKSMLLDLHKKYENLVELRHRVDKMDDIEGELKRIRTMTMQSKTEHNISSSMLATINSIKSDLLSMNDRLKSIYGEFNTHLDNFDNAIDHC